VQSDQELQQHLQGCFALIGGKGSASLLRDVVLCGAVTEWVTGSWAAYLIPALSWATISFPEGPPKDLRRILKSPASRSSDLCVLLTYGVGPVPEG
jgi:hypothetical protein